MTAASGTESPAIPFVLSMRFLAYMMQRGKTCAASNVLVLLSDDLPDLKSSSLMFRSRETKISLIAPALFAVAIICSAAAAAHCAGTLYQAAELADGP